EPEEAMPDFADTFIEGAGDEDVPASDAATLPEGEEIDFSFFQEALDSAAQPQQAPAAEVQEPAAPESFPHEEAFFLAPSDIGTEFVIEPADAPPPLEP